jgi:hypothetical protein
MINWGEADIAEMEIKELIYYVPILAIIIISPMDSLFPQRDLESARYLLSTLVQSEAAIIALIISLSLVVVQIAASSYSTRMIDIFKNSYYIWTLIWFYLISMVYGLYVLMRISKETNASLCADICLSYCLGVVSFFAVIPYIISMLEILKPEKIIETILQKITLDDILLDHSENDTNGVIQPLIDLIKSSILKYDEGAINYALKAIEDKIAIVIKDYDVNKSETQSKFGKSVSRWFSEIVIAAVNQNDRSAIVQTISTLEHIAIAAEELDLDIIASDIADSIENVGEMSIENGFEFGGAKVAISLRTIGEKSVERNLGTSAIKIVCCLHSLFVRVDENADKRKFASVRAFTKSAIDAIRSKSDKSKFFENIFQLEFDKSLDNAVCKEDPRYLIDIFACYNLLGLKELTKIVQEQMKILGLG